MVCNEKNNKYDESKKCSEQTFENHCYKITTKTLNVCLLSMSIFDCSKLWWLWSYTVFKIYIKYKNNKTLYCNNSTQHQDRKEIRLKTAHKSKKIK